MLLSFLAASYAFLQADASSEESGQPPILFLAEDANGRLQLYTATPANWQPQKLTQETADILNFAPSPNGQQIAYAAALPDGLSQIKLLSLNDGRASYPQTILTCPDAECSQPVWHPDGRRLLYERREPPNFSRPQLWWLDSQSGETRLLLEEETAIGSNARFSPDGNWVSFASSPEVGIRLYNFVDGRSLTFPSDVGTPVAWHPYGNQLLFQNSRQVIFHGEDNDDHDEHGHDFATAVSLYLASLGTQSTQLLSSDGAFNDGNAVYSPDGEWIVFGRRLARTNSGRQLWLMRADGSEAHALTEEIDTHFGPPHWSPDGRYMLFQTYSSNAPDQFPSITLLEVTTGEFTNLGSGILPIWFPSAQP